MLGSLSYSPGRVKREEKVLRPTHCLQLPDLRREVPDVTRIQLGSAGSAGSAALLANNREQMSRLVSRSSCSPEVGFPRYALIK